MKDLHPLLFFLAAGLFLGFLQFAALYQRGSNSNTTAHSIKRVENTRYVRTFLGRIRQVNGKYVFQDSAAKDTYFLDDPEKAKPLGGRSVKVVGMLDATKKTIHVL